MQSHSIDAYHAQIAQSTEETATVFLREKAKKDFDEAEMLVEEFRQKMVRTLHKEKTRLLEDAEKEKITILAKANIESAHLLEQARVQSSQIVEKARRQAVLESEALLLKARQQADQMIKEAEDSIRKTTRQKSQKEAEAIYNNAREEAARQTQKTLQAARKEADDIILKAKEEAEVVLQQIRSNADIKVAELTRSAEEIKQQLSVELMETRKKSWETIERVRLETAESAREKAQKEAGEIITQTRALIEKEKESWAAAAIAEARKLAEDEASRIRSEAGLEAEKIIESARLKTQSQFAESSNIIMGLQTKLNEVMAENGFSILPPQTHEKVSPDPVPDHRNIKPVADKAARPVVTAEIEKKPVETPPNSESTAPNITPVSPRNETTYKGSLKLNIAYPANITQIDSLVKQLEMIEGLKIKTTGGSFDGNSWIEIDIARPLQLMEILKNLPNIQSVTEDKKHIICLSLKSGT